jgi:predicted acetyltransferase
MTRLVLPDERYAESYRAFLRELDGEQISFSLSYPAGDFSALVLRLKGLSDGEGLPAGWVPISVFWQILGHEAVGVANVRHGLSDELRIYGGHIGYTIRPSRRRQGLGTSILRLALNEASQLGIQDVLVTCDKENTASARIIIGNGGVLDSESFVESQEAIIQRYWVAAATSAA